MLKTGDHVVAAKAMFGSCLHVVEQILPRFGITHTLVDGADAAAWEAAMRPETKLLFLETPSNPTLSLVDIAAVRRSRTRAARGWRWTMPLPPRPCSGRWSSAPTS